MIIHKKNYFNHFHLKVNATEQVYTDLNFDTQVNDCRLIGSSCSIEPKGISQLLFQYNSTLLKFFYS